MHQPGKEGVTGMPSLPLKRVLTKGQLYATSRSWGWLSRRLHRHRGQENCEVPSGRTFSVDHREEFVCAAQHAQWKALNVQTRTGNTAYSGLIYPIEHHQWMALMVSVNAPLPDTDEAFLEHARNLPVSSVYDAIKDATPISPIYRYQRTANQMRRYENLERLPDGFILIGDAVCAFNPVFGQGMSVSAMEAIMLDKELRTQSDVAGFSLRFQKEAAKLIAGPWQLATSEDARNLKEGEKVSLATQMFKVYMDHLFTLLATDPKVGKAFFDVFHLLKPPTSLFAPAVAVKVLRHMLTTRPPAKSPAPQPESVAEKHPV